MSDLIERDALIEKLESDREHFERIKDTVFAIATIGMINDIKKAPTIDAVEVVRCKDCKHYSHYWLDDHEECLIGVFSHTFGSKCEPNNFCCYGERKESE